MRILSLCRCVVLVLFASGSASGSAAAPAPMPVPERQNAAMAALYARAHAAAKVASDGATPELLRFMDDATFRANLTACCPAVAALPAAALLARYRAELEVVEMMHNFGAEPGGRHDDLDVAIGERSSYFQNLWELQYLGLVNTSGHSNEDCGNFMNWAEMELYGFPGMRGNGSCPASFAEAANRPIYVAFNQLKIDVGNPNFGDVSAVFRRGYVRNMTLIAAVDTGLWEMTCNRSGSGGHGFHHDPRNCTAWDPTGFDPATTQRLPVGTLDHYDHLVLANPRWFNGTFSLSDTFARLLGGRAGGGSSDWGAANASSADFTTYWESNFAGSVHYDVGGSARDGVSFLVASFPALFGTPWGRRLQAWAASRGWFLVWALGDDVSPQSGGGGSHRSGNASSVRMNKRVLDPAVLAATSAANLSDVKSAAAAASFDALYEEAAARRNGSSLAPGPKITTAEWSSRYAALLAALPAGARVQPLYAGACADTDRCMGVDMEGHCVCYA